MEGTPYIMTREVMLSAIGLPQNPPPWGTLVAVDVDTAEVVWESVLGTIRDLAPVPLSFKWGTPNMGGPIITAGGLVFIAATMDNYLRAFDVQTGEELWKGRLPAGGQATPMTYRLTPDGRWRVYAPHGLSDVFGLVVRPNPVLAPRAVYEAKTARWRRQWPELTVLDWPTA